MRCGRNILGNQYGLHLRFCYDTFHVELKFVKRPESCEALSVQMLFTVTYARYSTVGCVLFRLGRPPHLIMRIMDCVLILFQRHLDSVTQDPEKDSVKPSWGEALKMMTEGGFLNNLQNFNKDSINDEVCQARHLASMRLALTV